MTPSARVQSAIEILDALDASPAPADRLMSGWFRKRRFVGSKDRRAIRDHVYAVLRNRARIDWDLDRAGKPDPDGRARLIAALAQDPPSETAALESAFDGGQYGAPALSDEEKALASAIAGLTAESADPPDSVRGNYPDWLDAELRRAFGDGLVPEMAALNRPAAVDLRVNALKIDRAGARKALANDGLASEATPNSPLGLRLSERTTLPNFAAYRDGLIEVQDEASQLAALLVDAEPGMSVCDLCAGAGGKTLALAAAMENSGGILACDTERARMHPMASRLQRAGVDIVESRLIPAEDAGWAVALAGTFDRVLVDAPCSGTGTWRRNPDARWRLRPEDIDGCRQKQRALLALGAGLVRPGGRLIYATCSILPDENECQVSEFLADSTGFAVVPIPQVWGDAVGGACPVTGPYLFLTPQRHGTDGFFAAVLERRE